MTIARWWNSSTPAVRRVITLVIFYSMGRAR
jgi:hypothetical protein